MADLRDGTMLEKVKEQIENVRYEHEMLSSARITVLEWKTLFNRIERLEDDIKRCERKPNYDEY